jgi:hypothetical protein
MTDERAGQRTLSRAGRSGYPDSVRSPRRIRERAEGAGEITVFRERE